MHLAARSCHPAITLPIFTARQRTCLAWSKTSCLAVAQLQQTSGWTCTFGRCSNILLHLRHQTDVIRCSQSWKEWLAVHGRTARRACAA
eukprot:365602-Chlamydomonas_euryale.AAC.19